MSTPCAGKESSDFRFWIEDFRLQRPGSTLGSGALTGHCQAAIQNRKSKIVNRKNPPLQVGTDQQRCTVLKERATFPQWGDPASVFCWGSRAVREGEAPAEPGSRLGGGLAL